MRNMLVSVAVLVAAPAQSQEASLAAQRMAVAGPEARDIAARTGSWNVTATMWPSAGAQPVVTRGLIAERVMVGSILQETMRPETGAEESDFRRIDYLDFDRVEARWKYVSMDTRFPVSIMPAASFGPAENGRIVVRFQPQAFVGLGSAVEGRFMISEMEIEWLGPAREIKRQRFNLATGDGMPWVFVEYEYVRR